MDCGIKQSKNNIMIFINDIRGKIICLYGPTSSNKSCMALRIASKIPSVIINADAMQVYQNTTILTAQPKYNVIKSVTHKLYNFVQVTKNFSIYDWLKSAANIIQSVLKKQYTPIVVGGTGLYFTCLIEGLSIIPPIPLLVKRQVQNLLKKYHHLYDALLHYDQALARKLNKNDIGRIIRGLEVKIATGQSILTWHRNTYPLFSRKILKNIYIKLDRKIVYDSIEIRFRKMIQKGVIDEVRKLLQRHDVYIAPKIIGLESINNYLQGCYSYEQMVLEVHKLTKNYAKRQYTWFNNQLSHDLVIEKQYCDIY